MKKIKHSKMFDPESVKRTSAALEALFFTKKTKKICKKS